MLRMFVSLLTLSLFVAAPASAQDSPLELFGKDVGLVLRLAEPDKTTEHVVALISGVQPGFGEIARSVLGENLGKVISNPTLTGVDQSRDWHVGIYANGAAEPQVIFAIPAVDADDFVAALGEGFKSLVQGTYVLYTDKGELPAVPTAENSVVKLMDEKARAAFAMGDLALYVNSKQLSEKYRDEIDTAYDQVLEGLNQLRFALPQDAGLNMGPIIEMYGTLAEKLFQGVRDSHSMVVAISLGESGVRIEEYIDFGAGTKSARELAKLPTSEMADLGRLPAGAFAYYGASGGIGEMLKWSMDLTAGMSQDEAAKEKLKDILGQLDDVEFGAMVGSVSLGDLDGGMLEAVGIADVKPVDTFKNFMRTTVGAMAEIKMPGMTQTSELKTDAETYGDYKADVITVKQTFDEDLPQAEMQQKFQKYMFGEQGIQSRVVYMQDKYLTMMGGGAAAAKKITTSMEDSSTENPAITESRKIIMEKNNFLMLLDLPGGVAEGLKLASEIDEFPLPLDSQMIDNLGLSPSFIALGIAVEGNALRCRTDIPMSQIQGIFKLSMLFVGMQNQL